MSAEELPAGIPAQPPVAPARTTGRYLTLRGLTPDGRRLRLSDAAGAEYTLDVDARLRSALSGTATTAGDGPDAPSSASSPAPVRTPMDSMLRPRDIQARIRAGETPESVAAAAQTTLEKVMPFAAPVLAEREHVAERAQRSSIRRPAGETAVSSAARTLGEAITTHLHRRNVDPDLVTWDAWRREDGRWAVAGRYAVQGREGLAELTFDAPGNFVVLENDDARWLVGDLPDVLAEPEPSPEAPPARRLAAVVDPSERAPERASEQAVQQAAADPDQLQLGDDVLGLTTADQPLEAFLDDQPGLDESELVEEAAEAAAADADPEPDPEPAPHETTPEPPARRPVKKTRGRASVPSWDEIMFGGPND